MFELRLYGEGFLIRYPKSQNFYELPPYQDQKKLFNIFSEFKRWNRILNVENIEMLNEIVRNGWKYTGLTEDRALTADAVAQGYRISYNDAAMFYDEQPTSLKVALRQRLRWSKGHLMAFAESGPGLFLNIFCGKLFLKSENLIFEISGAVSGTFITVYCD